MSSLLTIQTAASFVLLAEPDRLAHLGVLDLAIIAVYFAMVLFIGFYLKRRGSGSRSCCDRRSGKRGEIPHLKSEIGGTQISVVEHPR